MSQLAVKQDISWQEILANTVSDPAELCRFLELDMATLPAGHPLLKNFPVRVPAPFLARMEKGNPRDPLLLQVHPAVEEAESIAGYSCDPLEESGSNPRPGILHKYRGRALILATSSCAIHCRYCFRRHFPYQENLPGRQQWQESLDYIAQDASLGEVIFSGGDPLTLPDKYLAWFFQQLADIKHVRRIRFHSRLPIMIPQRITPALCEILANPRFQTILVLHSNHAQEFDRNVDLACLQLKHAGVVLLNQSVLLRHINDSAAVLAALSERLFEAGVLPYYLHLLDRVQGAAHYDVSAAQGQRLIKEMRNSLSGYLVPTLVREIAGEGAKVPL